MTNANGFVLLVSYSPPRGGLSREVVCLCRVTGGFSVLCPFSRKLFKGVSLKSELKTIEGSVIFEPDSARAWQADERTATTPRVPPGKLRQSPVRF